MGYISHERAAEALKNFLHQRKLVDVFNISRADHHVCFLPENRLDELGNGLAWILIVGVGVDNDIRAVPQTRIQPGGKRLRKSLMAFQLHEMVDAVLLGDLAGSVIAPVIHDKHFNHIDPVNAFRQVLKRTGRVCSSLEQGI